MIRQTLAQRDQLRTAIFLYRDSRGGHINALTTQYNAGTQLLTALRMHARARFPHYNNYIIPF